MEKLSYFEAAGFDKKTAIKLEELCVEHNIPYEKVLNVIKNPKKMFLDQEDVDMIFALIRK